MKQIRICLSVAAIVFAVGGALATSAKSDALVTVTVTNGASLCPRAGTCDQIGGAQCKNAQNVDMYIKPEAGSCNVLATGTFAP